MEGDTYGTVYLCMFHPAENFEQALYINAGI